MQRTNCRTEKAAPPIPFTFSPASSMPFIQSSAGKAKKGIDGTTKQNKKEDEDRASEAENGTERTDNIYLL